jgi:pimeloyl-ACP methyl ester carboxylesterase
MRGILAAALACLASGLAAADGPPPPGRMVDVGGHLMHFRCTGEGSPAVVVEGGLGDFSTDWTLVQSGVAAFTRVCTYDRAGYAWSEPGPRPRTFAQINLELKEGLKALGERPPFVLVGHSFGGPVVRAYAAAYPGDVAGMVLVDGVHEDQRVVIRGKAVRIRDGAKGAAIPPPRLAVRADEKASGSAPPAPGPVAPPLDRLPPEAQRIHLWASVQPALDAVRSGKPVRAPAGR